VGYLTIDSLNLFLHCFFCSLFLFLFSVSFLVGFGLVPPPFVNIFPLFLNKFFEFGGIGWRYLRVST